MNDHKLDYRKDNYRKCCFSLLEKRENYNLSLRKQKLDDIILNKRLNIRDKLENSNLEIHLDGLDIAPEYKVSLIDNLVTNV